jgi:predicted methyltransferase
MQQSRFDQWQLLKEAFLDCMAVEPFAPPYPKGDRPLIVQGIHTLATFECVGYIGYIYSHSARDKYIGYI